VVSLFLLSAANSFNLLHKIERFAYTLHVGLISRVRAFAGVLTHVQSLHRRMLGIPQDCYSWIRRPPWECGRL